VPVQRGTQPEDDPLADRGVDPSIEGAQTAGDDRNSDQTQR